MRIYVVFKAGQIERIIQSLNARKSWNVLIHMYLGTLAGVHVISAVQYSVCNVTLRSYKIPRYANSALRICDAPQTPLSTRLFSASSLTLDNRCCHCPTDEASWLDDLLDAELLQPLTFQFSRRAGRNMAEWLSGGVARLLLRLSTFPDTWIQSCSS